jgi:hypothetical protein
LIFLQQVQLLLLPFFSQPKLILTSLGFLVKDAEAISRVVLLRLSVDFPFWFQFKLFHHPFSKQGFQSLQRQH